MALLIFCSRNNWQMGKESSSGFNLVLLKGMGFLKTLLLHSLSVDSLCFTLCHGSFPDKKKIEEDRLCSPPEESPRLKLVSQLPF